MASSSALALEKSWTRSATCELTSSIAYFFVSRRVEITSTSPPASVSDLVYVKRIRLRCGDDASEVARKQRHATFSTSATGCGSSTYFSHPEHGGRTKRKVIAVVQHAPVPSEIRPEGEQFGWWKTMAAHALHVMAARPEWFTIAEHTELYDYSVGLTDEGRDVARDAALEAALERGAAPQGPQFLLPKRNEAIAINTSSSRTTAEKAEKALEKAPAFVPPDLATQSARREARDMLRALDAATLALPAAAAARRDAERLCAARMTEAYHARGAFDGKDAAAGPDSGGVTLLEALAHTRSIRARVAALADLFGGDPLDARSSSSSSSSLALFDVVVGDIAPRARHRTAVFPTTRSRRLFDARDVVERARVGARALRRVRRRP